MRAPHPAWLPPLLVGASAAIAAEVAMAMLLYAGPGLVRSLTTVLAVQGVALAGGLWAAPRPRPDLLDRLRRRWLWCLISFISAAVYGTAWSLPQALVGGPAGQGLGLALLAAFPLYTCGTVLGGMSSVAASDPVQPGRGPGAAAALGAGIGFVITGGLLPRAPIPASLLVACLVLLSAAGMIYGMVLGDRLQVHVRAARPSKGGDVRVEDRRVAAEDLADRYLYEGAHVRRRQSLEEAAAKTPWDVAVARALMPGGDEPWSVLVLGGGASTLPKTLVQEHPSATVEVLERTGAVVELARDHFETDLRAGSNGRVDVRVGNLEDLVADAAGPYDLVLVDTSALAPMGGTAALSRVARRRLVSALRGTGTIAWGPVATEPGTPELGEEWIETVLERGREGDEELLLLARTGVAGPVSMPIEDFVPVNGGRPAQ